MDRKDDGLWLNEAMTKGNKKFYKDVLNILNAPAGSGKTTFIFNEFLNKSYDYVNGIKNKYTYSLDLDKVLYVCDTNMLKSSVLENNQNLTKVLGKDELKKAMKGKGLQDLIKGNNGYIKVITYSTLGWLLNQAGARHILFNYYKAIIMDEMHNLFKYANRFDTEEKKPYGTVINDLKNFIANNVLIIGISATTGRIYNGLRDKGVSTNTIFKHDEFKHIRQLKHEMLHHTNHMMNEIKWIALNYDWFREKKNYKIMIYTNTIQQSEKYKLFLENAGYKVEWLCSINNTTTISTIDDEGKEIVEIVKTMNDYQIELREQLLKTGIIPDELDILIVNGGYETGWNLKDNRIQFVFVDSTEYDTHIQARNRVRHDIKYLCVKERCTCTGEILEYDQYRNDQPTGASISIPLIARYLEEKFIGVKLSADDKKYLVSKYAIRWYDEPTVNWKTFKRDLEKCDFIVKTYKNKGTYIFKKGYEVKKDSVKEVKRMDNENLIVNWLKNEWDKERIPCNEVRDILDFGRKTWDKIIKSEYFTTFLETNRITMKPIKGMGKTLYFKTY